MKRILKSILIAMAVSTPFVSPLCAQQHGAVAEIPFRFVANRTALPAGTYTVSRKTVAGTLVISGRSDSIFTQQLSAKADRKSEVSPSLTFVCYNRQDCILTQVSLPNEAYSHVLPAGELEKYRAHHVGMASLVKVKLTAGR